MKNFKELWNSDIHRDVTVENFDNAKEMGLIMDSVSMNGGDRSLIIAIEELGEVQHELTKILRGVGDREALIEEMADLHIVTNFIKIVVGLQEDKIARARAIKCDRMEQLTSAGNAK